MLKIESVAEMQTLAALWRAERKTVALVPTMGALHSGQEALIKAAVAQADIVVVSIFLNTLQFSPNEVVARYPRSPVEDLALCEACGAQVVFLPPAEEIYPKGFSSYVTEDVVSKLLCGVSRPTHFRGVTTITAKLFHLVQPQKVFFGQKTLQRAMVVRKMSADLQYGVEVVVVPSARDVDGLAAGVRNRDFTPNMRLEALSLFKALQRGKEMADNGVRSPDRIIAEATHILGQHRRVRIIYISIVDVRTMEAVREVTPGSVALVMAAWIDEVRLIDNILL